MAFKHISLNGELKPEADAKIPLSNIEYQYGFGVYETIRVSKGIIYFIDDHIERLTHSAEIIGLTHPFTPQFVEESIRALAASISEDTYNLKILLIGGKEPLLYIVPLNPKYPDKSLYRDGIDCVTYEYERAFPRAKSLNMLQSYLAYTKAKDEGAYDALLINKKGAIVEGTRTNFYCIKGKTIYSPPEAEILLGVTRKAVLKVARDNGYFIEEKDIDLDDLASYGGAFLTSTSSKILPIRSIGGYFFGEIPEDLRDLMRAFDEFLASSEGKMS